MEEKQTSEKIADLLTSLNTLLQTKNQRYGDSMQKPVNVFVKEADRLDNSLAIRKRLDEKLSRIANSDSLRKNDVVDTMGYLVLLCVENNWTNFDDLID